MSTDTREALAALPPLPEPAQDAQSEGYMSGCPTPIPASPDFYTAEQMQAYARAALAAQAAQPSAQGEAVAFEGLTKEEVNAIWWAHNEEPTPTFRFSVTQDIASALARRWLASAPAAPAQAVPLTESLLRELLEDTREVFDADGAETPQSTRDVIEYMHSWLQVYADKSRGIKAAP